MTVATAVSITARAPTLVQQISNGFRQLLGLKLTPAGTTAGTIPNIVTQAKTGYGAISSGAGGKVLVTGAGVGVGTAAAGAGIGYGLEQIASPIETFTAPIDQLTGLGGTGNIMIIGIIILVLLLLLKGLRK